MAGNGVGRTFRWLSQTLNVMNWSILGLVAFDLILLAMFYLALQSHAPLGRRTLSLIAAGLAGFVFHAFTFFSGAVLIVQLATVAGVFFICVAAPRSSS